MRNCCIAMLFIVMASPALAGNCDAWTAGLEPDEGGSTMTASICAADQPGNLLLIACGGEDKLGLRLLADVEGEFPPGDNMDYRSSFVFSSGARKAEVALRYEAMDGAMTATPRRNSDVVRILKSAGSLTILDKAGVLPTLSFTLKGSSAAIGKVERACYS